jgi:predicted nucleic acid-binding Zn ribbon protein
LNAARAGRRRERSPGKGNRPVAIRDAMQSLVRELGIAPKMAQYDVIAAWPDVVGPQIARVTDPQRMENGVLYVAVSTATWRAELSMKRLELIEKLNACIGMRVLHDIRFR